MLFGSPVHLLLQTVESVLNLPRVRLLPLEHGLEALEGHTPCLVTGHHLALNCYQMLHRFLQVRLSLLGCRCPVLVPP